jgi:hypothetical protein
MFLSMAGMAWGQFNVDMPGASPTPAIHDIRPPVNVFPYPMWMVATAAGIAAVLLGFIAGMIVKAAKNRPKTPPPTPREIALKRLKEAQKDLESTQPYAFSIRVSDILRQYIAAQYRVHAPEQTSQEFLAEAARSPHFTGADKLLLSDFLERCDLIKFANINATMDDSRGMLSQAMKFAEGAAAV